MTSFDGSFTWPASGLVEAPDWDPKPECGGGLHGFLLGCGDGQLADWSESANWLVVEIDRETLIDLEGKVKFPRGNVMFCGDREGAIAVLEGLAPEAKHMPVIGARRMVGDNQVVYAGYYGKAVAGAYGNAEAGYGGTAIAGYGGKAIATAYGNAVTGNNGKAVAGAGGKAEAGAYGKAEAGDNGKAVAGDYGKAIAGAWGKAVAGYNGSAIAGAGGTAIAGDYGKAEAGYRGKAVAGEGGKISIEWWDGNRSRTAIGYIGEDGLKPNIPYPCNEEGKFVAVVKEEEKGNGSSADEFASLDSLPVEDLAKQSLQTLRRYAALHLKIIGASKIPGGKAKLLEKIQAKRKG